MTYPDHVRSFFRDPIAWLQGGGFPARSDVDVEETPDGWVVEARLPGVAPEEVEVEVSDRELVIRTRHPSEVEGQEFEESEHDNRLRAMKSQYSRSAFRMGLPSSADPDKVDATMDHGLLVVRLPHSTSHPPRRIAVGRTRPTFSQPASDLAEPPAPAHQSELAEPADVPEPRPAAN
jgi:HSP20 family protein